ncbi:PAS domain S-box protein [Allomyces macrogynus ATCC 38327]|uniref:PAS domain S-box protein n=1 Tax=Allomyces macrogynus (strain ATCC 38327) TaxID=578462 RepID=A0A0L0SPR5_ALLM3|nr:PAS domain S-box protein [Allomyces macrogynus ATCC 38327]|eukprot:KNE64375.1 PAS domain S-box protein [Allomyces macrogynus ATCC 38327]
MPRVSSPPPPPSGAASSLAPPPAAPAPPAPVAGAGDAVGGTAAAAGAHAQAAAKEPTVPDHMPNPLFGSFTKAKDWAQKLIDELSDFIFVLSPQGNIVYVSTSSRAMVGFHGDELVGHHISEFIHPDDACQLSVALQDALIHRTPYQLVPRFRRKNADYMILEVHGRVMTIAPPAAPSTVLLVNVGREYPGKLSPFLDSVLDLRAENDRLLRRKRQLDGVPEPPVVVRPAALAEAERAAADAIALDDPDEDDDASPPPQHEVAAAAAAARGWAPDGGSSGGPFGTTAAYWAAAPGAAGAPVSLAGAPPLAATVPAPGPDEAAAAAAKKRKRRAGQASDRSRVH